MQLSGKQSVYLSELGDDNREDYLSVYKAASNLHEYYEKNPGLWAYMREHIGKDEDSSKHYIVRETDSGKPCGYINIDIENNHPSIDIAIVPDFRNKGYGYEAAWLLCKSIFEKAPDETVLWNVFPQNTYSRKIAEKLGGQQIDSRDMLSEILERAFGTSVSGKGSLPDVIVYAIRREPNYSGDEQ